MALFTVICHDKPGALEQRMHNRPDHVAYLKTVEPILRVAGPLLDAQGQMCGSMFVIEVADEAAAYAFAAGDPFNQRGVFGQVEVKGFSKTLGSWS